MVILFSYFVSSKFQTGFSLHPGGLIKPQALNLGVKLEEDPQLFEKT
jgi:hypothetical protein